MDEERLRRMAKVEPPRVAATHTNFRTILYKKEGNIAIISHNRPHVLNARNVQLYYDSIAAFEEAELDPDVHAIVLTGEGRYMCSGADTTGGAKKGPLDDLPDPPRVTELKAVKWLPTGDGRIGGESVHDSSTWPAVRFINKYINCPKLLIAAVNGPVIGEGCSSLVHADVVYAVDTATFWTPFHRIAAVPEFCSSVLLRQRVGANIANEMLLMSKKKTAAELHAAGLVNEVLPAGENFLPAVLDRVREGLELSGDPSVRDQSMRLFKGMMKTQEERNKLMVLNQREQELSFGWHGRSRVGQVNAKYYAKSMPTRLGGREKK
eukprot:gnl/TRDRNA2_/TRDRNA2_147046_c0_seq1.p1 gnl/TRDRNA2_/TRDRNA2_147046_c0~~gnl/TRDRNA2_/TRDRNA2_147046_c0_seq1.p1  ORF type:complete len:365 (+),score=78.34 gnl/TRDRNA2_/TRDRNA2_147046_c0_seq1:132-1097(+)